MPKQSDTHFFVKPGFDGAVINQPERGGEVVPVDGCWVPKNSFWQRRIADEDVVKTTPPKKAPAPKTPKE